MVYLMESGREAERLLVKSEDQSTREQLIQTGLKSGMKAADAGGGVGFVSKIMADIVGVEGSVSLLDQSQDRLSSAKLHCRPHANIDYLETDLENTKLAENSFDYIFCRFVFEYLQNPEAVFSELLRLVKPGGKLVIGDLDYNLLSHYPLSEKLEAQLKEAIQKLESLKLWDPYAGRKLYRYFYRAGLENIRVQLIPHHFFYGTVPEKDVRNWEMKLDQISDLCDRGVLKLSYNVQDFRTEFLNFFRNPERFSYTPLILVEGSKTL